MSARTVVQVQYIKTVSDVNERVKYVGFRAREQEEEELGLFNERFDHGVRADNFVGDVKHDPALQHDMTVKVHTLVLSFRQEDYDAMEVKGINVKDVTREFVRDLEERKGLKLTWVAAVHQKEGHPHVHLVVKSVGPDLEGKRHRLRFDSQDFTWMRNNLDRIVDRHVPQQEQTKNRTLDNQRPSSRPTQHAIHRSVNQALNELDGNSSIRKQANQRMPKRYQKRPHSRQQLEQQGNQGINESQAQQPKSGL